MTHAESAAELSSRFASLATDDAIGHQDALGALINQFQWMAEAVDHLTETAVEWVMRMPADQVPIKADTAEIWADDLSAVAARIRERGVMPREPGEDLTVSPTSLDYQLGHYAAMLCGGRFVGNIDYENTENIGYCLRRFLAKAPSEPVGPA